MISTSRLILAQLVVSLLSLASFDALFAQAPPTVPASEAVVQIKRHADVIVDRTREMNALYQNAEFGGNFDQRLADAGADVGAPQRHLLRFAWSQGGAGFYTYHLNALRESIAVVEAQGYAVLSDLDYLDHGMEAWKENEQRVQGLFSEQFAMLVKILKSEDIFKRNSGYGEYLQQNPMDPEGIIQRQLFSALQPDTTYSAPGAKDEIW